LIEKFQARSDFFPVLFRLPLKRRVTLTYPNINLVNVAI